MTPKVVVFDVNETLSDLSALEQVFVEVGAPRDIVPLWFASVLRDGFALTAAGSAEPFSKLAIGALDTVLADHPLNRELDAAIDQIMKRFLELPVHPDVADGVRTLAASHIRLITLSNGSTQVAEQLFTRAGILEYFERLLSVEDTDGWKPAPAAYAYAANTCSVDPGDMILVAVHPWDIDGAKRAGLQTAWLNRRSQNYPDYFLVPDYTVANLPELAGLIG
ncbi:haloacid dehalogenase type II [Ferrimicrobium acidiphilum]|uniref:haloacid dehalogenase type II n=1 Tax=Ferrimicrobium acidiphilum TaxID=121039 RepID=UPI0023F4CEA4|nr:haloacid dehalogenase type II [Ferrimicrobium acidiphilum]